MAFKLPKKFSPGYSTTEKPTCPVKLDRKNSFAPDNFWLLNGFGYGVRDLATNTPLTIVGTPDFVRGSLEFSGVQNNNHAYTQLIPSTVTPFDFTLQVKVTVGANTTGECLILQWGNATADGTPFLLVKLNSSGYLTVYFDQGYDYTSGVNLRGNDYTLTFTGKTDGTYSIYINEENVYTTVYGSWGYASNQNKLWLNTGFGNSNSITAIYHYLYFKRGRVADIDGLIREPYQVLKPSIDTIYFTDTTESIGGIDVDIPKSDISLTSFQPVVNISQHITAEIPQHDLSLLSHIPSVTIGANIDVIAPQHNISINSYPPAVVTSNNISLDIPVHDINLLSYAPSIITSESIDLDIPLHSINIISYAPIAVASNFIDAEIPDHNININSHAPVISLGAIIENIIPAHNISITGYAPDVAISEHINSIIPEHNISLLSYAPEILANSSVNAIIPKNDIQITSHIPRVLIAGSFTTAKERIYGYPAINRIYTMTRR